MAQHFEELKKSISEMTTEELKAHVQTVRSKKYVEKKATQKRRAKAEKREGKNIVNKVSKLAGGLSKEDVDDLLKSIGG